MTTKNVRGRIATACVATMLVAVGAVLAQTRVETTFEFCPAAARYPAIETPPAVATDLWAPAVPLIRINDTPPWFRKTFFLFGTDGTCPAKLAIVVPAKELRASVQLAVSESRLPGTVTNLRRTDRR